MTRIMEKMQNTKMLVVGVAIVLLMGAVSSLAGSIALVTQTIPCIFLLGQPKMPEAMQNAIREKENA